VHAEVDVPEFARTHAFAQMEVTDMHLRIYLSYRWSLLRVFLYSLKSLQND
jgi:hypothetical protein